MSSDNEVMHMIDESITALSQKPEVVAELLLRAHALKLAFFANNVGNAIPVKLLFGTTAPTKVPEMEKVAMDAAIIYAWLSEGCVGLPFKPEDAGWTQVPVGPAMAAKLDEAIQTWHEEQAAKPAPKVDDFEERDGHIRLRSEYAPDGGNMPERRLYEPQEGADLSPEVPIGVPYHEHVPGAVVNRPYAPTDLTGVKERLSYTGDGPEDSELHVPVDTGRVEPNEYDKHI
jgi:hypothetical protein